MKIPWCPRVRERLVQWPLRFEPCILPITRLITMHSREWQEPIHVASESLVALVFELCAGRPRTLIHARGIVWLPDCWLPQDSASTIGEKLVMVAVEYSQLEAIVHFVNKGTLSIIGQDPPHCDARPCLLSLVLKRAPFPIVTRNSKRAVKRHCLQTRLDSLPGVAGGRLGCSCNELASIRNNAIEWIRVPISRRNLIVSGRVPALVVGRGVRCEVVCWRWEAISRSKLVVTSHLNTLGFLPLQVVSLT